MTTRNRFLRLLRWCWWMFLFIHPNTKNGVTTASAFSSSSSSSSSPIPPPPPLSMPVWSLACPAVPTTTTTTATATTTTTTTSMNIMTFCTPVSIQPKLWALSLYHDTLTKDSFLSTQHGILQLLTLRQAPLIPILGKQSGYDPQVDKAQECQQAFFGWKDMVSSSSSSSSSSPTTTSGSENKFENYHQVLSHCALYLQVQLQSTIDAGDHVVAICQVTNTGIWDKKRDQIEWKDVTSSDEEPLPPLDDNDALYTGWLREQGLL